MTTAEYSRLLPTSDGGSRFDEVSIPFELKSFAPPCPTIQRFVAQRSHTVRASSSSCGVVRRDASVADSDVDFRASGKDEI
jgi:hypothetical protein